jgi:phosphate/phosphite/phosphonate ABC transporter binding protein
MCDVVVPITVVHGMRVTKGRVAAPFVAAAVALAGCDTEPPRQRVRLTTASTSTVRRETPTVLRVGIASVLSSGESLAHYRDLVEFLGERLGIPTEMVRKTNYAEMNELMRGRYCPVGLVCNYAFVRARKEFGAEALAVPQVDGKTTYRAYIIVGRDSPAHSVEELRGKTFAFADPLCNAGWLYPRFRIRQLSRSPFDFFGGESFSYSYEKSIRAVAAHLADAAGVESPLYDGMVAANDPAALATRIVDRSPLFGNPPLVVHPELDPAVREGIRKFLLNLHENERGRTILAGIHVDRFVPPEPDQYATVDAMAVELERP